MTHSDHDDLPGDDDPTSETLDADKIFFDPEVAGTFLAEMVGTEVWALARARWMTDDEKNRGGETERQVDEALAAFAMMMLTSWRYTRKVIGEAMLPSSDELFVLGDPQHRGDQARHADVRAARFIEELIHLTYRRMPVYGEENRPTSLALSHEYPWIAYVDPIDGSAQAWALPGCWGTVVIIQKFVGVRDGRPVMEIVLVGVVDAEGAVTIAGPTTRGAIVVSDVLPGEVIRIEDQTLISGAFPDGLTGVLNVLYSGYKPSWRPHFRSALDVLPKDSVTFNVAGAPASRKAILNPDVVVVQRQPSTLWDAAGAYIIAQAGGFVVEYGTTEPLPREVVEGWFNQIGYSPDAAGELREVLVPGYVAGMHWNSVIAVATSLRHLRVERCDLCGGPLTGHDPSCAAAGE